MVNMVAVLLLLPMKSVYWPRMVSVSTKNIRQTLDKIKVAVQQVNSAVMEVAAVAHHQAQVLMEVTPTIDQLTNLADTIVMMAKGLTSDNYLGNYRK